MQISKYSASGNDFIIFHTFRKKNHSKLAKKLCDRHEGIGADGLIVLLPTDEKEIDFRWQFYNSDGSKASMCGNGTRAAAHYAYNNLLAKKTMSFLTKAGVIQANVEKNTVEVTLTNPKILQKSLFEDGFEWGFYDTGVPHLVCFSELENFNLALAKKLREKYNANVNFAKIENEKLFVRTYERGVEDETLACGTGMAACFYHALINKQIKEKIEVFPKSKERLELKYKDKKMYFKGEVLHAFDTNLQI